MLDKLAELEHDRWSRWMMYQFKQGTMNEDGTWTMPKWAVDRWSRQITTTYQGLPESKQISDRREAERTLAVVSEQNKAGIVCVFDTVMLDTKPVDAAELIDGMWQIELQDIRDLMGVLASVRGKFPTATLIIDTFNPDPCRPEYNYDVALITVQIDVTQEYIRAAVGEG